MWKDPVVEEVRRVRDEHASQFNYDVDAIVRDLKRQEAESGRVFVSYPPKRTGRRRTSDSSGGP